MKKIISISLILFSVICFSQQKYQSLLWEITGKNLNKPSYLYGTMHVSKKVAFRLDDVFFKALNESDCIALESDPRTWPGFNYNLMLNEMAYYNTNGNEFYTNLFKLTHPEKMALRASVRMDNNAVNAYLYRKNNASDNFEEETYLDLFIFQAGKKNNKEIYGLEDLAESTYLTTKAAYNANKKNLDPWIQKLYAKENPYLIQENLYRNRNLDLLDSIGAGVNTNFYREHMLFIRNENMVVSLDKLMSVKSVFAGVGAAHLPGEKGMINILRQRGYTVKALTSKQSGFSKSEKNKLDSLFVTPELKMHYTPDGFLGLNTHDKLREFSYAGQKYYLDPDMTNGAYLTVNRVSRFLYLPNLKDNINLNDIDNLLYEDIPGDIIKKEILTDPYPGISIVNKTKKGEFQKYHIYQTPLEIIIIKFAGRSDFVLQHEAKIFDSISLKVLSDSDQLFLSPLKKFQVNFPEYFITSNMGNSGKKLLEGYKNNAYYFLIEATLHDMSYIEEDSFEAKYFHHALHKNYKLSEVDGRFKAGDYKTYESRAILDSTTNKNLHLKTIVKDGSYYLLGYVGAKIADKTAFFESFKFNKTDYKGFEKVVDTALHFSVKTNAITPIPDPYSSASYKEENTKDYAEQIKSTIYTTKANEQISITRRKFHDLQMYSNIDSLWKETEVKVNYGYYLEPKPFTITDRSQSKADSTYTYSFSYTDSLSAKRVLIKNILKKGVLFELKTLIDSISGPSTFISEFYKSFTPIDTLMGKSVLKDKSKQFFEALEVNDSIVLESYNLIKFKKHNIEDLKSALYTIEFKNDYLDIKSHLIKKLIEIDLKNNVPFLTQLYIDSYSEPQTQTSILDGLLDSNTKSSYNLALELMELDVPLNGINTIFYNYYGKDSLQLKASLFPKILEYSSINEYKQPLYRLLARVRDSGFIKLKSYSKYKNQLINDGKIEVKRSLGRNSTYNYGYNSHTIDLSTYVKLIYPYRNELSAQDFFEKLLNVEDNKALVNYYVLLTKSNKTIPEKLKEKILKDEENQYLLVEALDNEKLLNKLKATHIDQQQFAKSKLLSQTSYEKGKDDLSFILKRNFMTEKGKDAVLYFFKIEKDDEYSGKIETLHYISFIKSGTPNQLVVDYYNISQNYGTPIDKTKELEEQYNEIINLTIYKNRKRVTPSPQSGNDYFDY